MVTMGLLPGSRASSPTAPAYRSDTASAFNISVGDVSLTGVSQIARRVLYVHVSASIPVDVAPDASEDDVRAALNVKSLSADGPILLLAENPDQFFGRTTKVGSPHGRRTIPTKCISAPTPHSFNLSTSAPGQFLRCLFKLRGCAHK